MLPLAFRYALALALAAPRCVAARVISLWIEPCPQFEAERKFRRNFFPRGLESGCVWTTCRAMNPPKLWVMTSACVAAVPVASRQSRSAVTSCGRIVSAFSSTPPVAFQIQLKEIRVAWKGSVPPVKPWTSLALSRHSGKRKPGVVVGARAVKEDDEGAHHGDRLLGRRGCRLGGDPDGAGSEIRHAPESKSLGER